MTISETLYSNKNYIIDSYNNGLSTIKLGRIYRCNSKTIAKFLQDNKVQIKKIKKYSKASKERLSNHIIYLYSELNDCISDISIKLGCGTEFIYKILKEKGAYKARKSSNKKKINNKSFSKLYENGLSITKIAKINNCSEATVFNGLKKGNVKIRPRNTYKFNNKILENGINTPELAWMWGLWLTDGNVKRYCIRISLVDLDVIEKLKIIFNYNGCIKSIKGSHKHKRLYSLCISNKDIANRFKEMGCILNKTHKTTFPSFISDNIISHFIRGVIDGDGSISKNYISITGNLALLNGIKEKIISILGFHDNDFKFYNRHPNRKNNIRDMRILKKNKRLQFLKWIYFHSMDSNRMARKFDKFISVYNIDVNHIK